MPNSKGFNGFLSISPYVPLAILSLLLAAYVGLLLRSGDVAHLGMSGLFMLGAGSLLWERRGELTFKSTWLDIILGTACVILALAISGLLLNPSPLLASEIFDARGLRRFTTLLIRSVPIISGLGVALIGFGRSGLHQVWRELGILVALGLPGILATYAVDISPVTARFSTALLWYSQIDVLRDGVYIYLVQDNAVSGGVEVYSGCSGIESMAYLLGLSGLCLVMFPISGWKRYLTPFMGLVLGFVINGIRVSLMAFLVGHGRNEAFDYWHEGDGSLLFGLFAVIAFGAFYMGIQTLDQRSNCMLGVELSENSTASVETLSPAMLAFLEEGESDSTRRL